MLYLILAYLVISFLCLSAGWLFYEIITGSSSTANAYTRPIISYLISGLIFLTAFGQWLVLFLPLNIFTLFILLIALSILILARKKNILSFYKQIIEESSKNNFLFFLCIFIFLGMIVTINAGPTIMDDTESYHIQMIKWAQEYGSVPGIANLHLRFGFNSSWFISIGLLCPRLNGINNYISLNGLLSLWLSYYLLEKIFYFFKTNGFSKNAALASFVIIVVCLVNWPMIRGNAANANYDFITCCCVIVLFVEYIIVSRTNPPVEWLIWPCYLFTVRIINFPLLLLTIYSFFVLYKSDHAKKIIRYAFAACLLIVPFIARNIILSGFPFFPVYQLDFFQFDWKADKQKIIEMTAYIKYFNRVNNGNQSLALTRRLQFPQWVASWYAFLSIYDKIITASSFVSYAAFLIFRKKIMSMLQVNDRFFIWIMIVQLIAWFFIAPDPRFAYGPLLPGICILICILPVPDMRILAKVLKFSILSTSVVLLFYTINKIVIDSRYHNWVTPHDLPVPPVRKIVIDGIELHIPGRILDNWNPRCYDIALPCLYQIDRRLRARGSTIKNGFKLLYSDSSAVEEGEYQIKP